MSCLLVKQNLIAFLEKTISPEKEKEIQEHLDLCNSCREICNKFSVTYKSLDNAVIPELSDYFYTRVVAKLERNRETEVLLPSPIIRALQPLVGGLAFLTIITFGIIAGKYMVTDKQLPATQTNTVNVSSFADEYYLDTNEDALVDLFINNEK